MLNAQDRHHLETVRADTVRSLIDAIGPAQPVALLDAPALVNVGDSMIWAGQVAYMARAGYEIKHVSDMQSYDPRRIRKALPDGGVLLLRGGGNFGDIWIGHQNFREQVAHDFPDYKIVQLTQSIMFRDLERAHQADLALSGHPSFRVLIRDVESLERAAMQVPSLDMVSSRDMALGWEPEPTKREASYALVIARADKEASSGLAVAARGWDESFDVRVTDWGQHAPVPDSWHRARAILRFNGKLVYRKRRMPWLPSLPQPIVQGLLDHVINWNLDTAVDLFSGARAVVVDRLHAHVLASLLGIPHVVLDNDHGKIGAVYREYTGQFTTAHFATSVDEAHAKLRELMA